MATSLLFPPVSSGTVFCSSSTCFSKSEKFSLSSLSASQLLCKSHRRHHLKVRALKETTKEPNTSPPPSAEEITEKFGLEVGLWKIFSSKEGGKEGKGEKSKGDQAKELLAKYGGAYLATSITLSLISFSLCYVLISAGIDVQALLQKVGITANETGEKVGTFALAYAAHKAASPIRFPPTVALTPIVAGWIGKKTKKEE
ncbi:PREDICTED: uncharacterized protein LOC104601362 [Nelumbo nucifera]|uniref:Uncharacterized protein LOC104601362 n=1 Tax=Nelumbo nucifera TaxID=4432 RepID=A0A1U8A6R8_NELNU|nr:PREDICTED: uncharacterized protein LOC104601362 [Nelumbo nucifera]XP_010262958.1 PREDICTED: uncharacterized protein LOC104601362 [Nelumbo nucifera]